MILKFLSPVTKKIKDVRYLAHLKKQDQSAHQIIIQVLERNLSHLRPAALVELHQIIEEIENSKVDGIFVEAGCALGGSSLVIAASKKKSRRLRIYDVFDQIPSPSRRDGSDAHERYEIIESGKSKGIGGEKYYGYQKDLLSKVREEFENFELPLSENEIELIKGEFENTMTIEEPVAFAHIDADWFDSVMICLQRVEPNLSPRGVIVVDDYYDWSGCRLAVDEFFSDKREDFTFTTKEALHVTRR